MTFREIRFASDEYRRECALREEVLRTPLGLSLRDEDLAREEDQWHYGLFEPDAELVACAIAAPISSTEAAVRQMAVSPSRQRKGLGVRLMNELENALRARGIGHVTLNARSSAVGFYERMGYTATGTEFLEVTIPHVRMVKALSPAGPARDEETR